jgi:type II secretion system protein J
MMRALGHIGFGVAPRRCLARAFPRAPHPDSPEHGFTMIEVLVSVAILAAMATLIWGSFAMTARGQRRVEATEDRYHGIRLSMNRLAREISMAYLSKNDVPGAVTPRTLFVSQRNHRVDDLMFSGLSHLAMRADAKESDQSVVRYFGAPDPANRSRTNLMRRESRRLGGQRVGETGPADVLLEDVTSLHFEYFDEAQNEWRESWNTTSADGQPDRLPAKVRITLTLRDDSDREITFLSATRTFMRDPLWFGH